MSLSDRFKSISAEMPRGWQSKLAKKCGVKPPSVNDWLSGKTKNLEGTHLNKAADFFGVSPEWLATGTGPKFPNPKNTSVRHSSRELDPAELVDAFEALFKKLNDSEKEDVISLFVVFAKSLRPITKSALIAAISQERTDEILKKA